MQELCCSVFKAARNRYHSRKMLWRKMRGLFDSHFIKDWFALYAALIWEFEGTVLETKIDDTSSALESDHNGFSAKEGSNMAE